MQAPNMAYNAAPPVELREGKQRNKAGNTAGARGWAGILLSNHHFGKSQVIETMALPTF